MKSAAGIAKMLGLGLAGFAAGAYLVRQARKVDLKNSVVLIMGGSRGLALELARCFAAEGAILALAARDSRELAEARKKLDLPEARLYTFVCDVTNSSQVNGAIAAVERQVGEVDVLVNNAGLIEVGPMEVQTIEDYNDSMDTHFWGPLYATEAVVPSMRRRRRGRIVNIASIAGLVSVPHLLPYCASKHALVGFSEGLRTELLKDNIFVTTVCPGLMRTGSPRNANFKGHNRIEFALFSLLDALPFTSISAAKAASQIVRACKHGDANLVISIQAQAAKLVHSLAPEFASDLFGLSNIILPGEGGIGTASAKGRDSESAISPSILTVLSELAALRNNE
ncbi:MAG TPA: SDR family NAD(P)-dependent oxidoreductase [Oculatellaceae cyanobacterium]